MTFFEKAQRDELLGELKDIAKYAYLNAPRSLQKTLGPSEIGHGCDRRLAYALARSNDDDSVGRSYVQDPWPSIMGTAGHAWLADAVKMANERLGEERWLSEHRVTAWDDVEGGKGTCDLFDTHSKSVFDFKINGPTQFKKYVRHGPGPQYKGQVNVYGAGYVEEGHEVENVGILFIPRAGYLRDAHLWFEAFDPTLAASLHEKIRTITSVVAALEVDKHPTRFQLIPINPGPACSFCPHLSADVGTNPYRCMGTYQK